jgi:hypothetical protein
MTGLVESGYSLSGGREFSKKCGLSGYDNDTAIPKTS